MERPHQAVSVLLRSQADGIIEGLVAHGLSSVMSGMDNVRNITGSPISGIDPVELIDVRQLCHGGPPLTLQWLVRGSAAALAG